MNQFTIDPSTYSCYDGFLRAVTTLKEELPDNYLSLLDKLVECDDVPDLTGVYAHSRDNFNLHVATLYDGKDYKKELTPIFGKTLEFSKTLPGVAKIELIAIGPRSIVPNHLDDMDRPAFDFSHDWYGVIIGVLVPSDDPKMLGIQIGESIHNHTFGKSIVFDTQIPHSAWNNTDQWWLLLRLSILKKCFKG